MFYSFASQSHLDFILSPVGRETATSLFKGTLKLLLINCTILIQTTNIGVIGPIESERQVNSTLSSHQALKQFNPCFAAFVIQPPLKHPKILVITANN